MATRPRGGRPHARCRRSRRAVEWAGRWSILFLPEARRGPLEQLERRTNSLCRAAGSARANSELPSVRTLKPRGYCDQLCSGRNASGRIPRGNKNSKKFAQSGYMHSPLRRDVRDKDHFVSLRYVQTGVDSTKSGLSHILRDPTAKPATDRACSFHRMQIIRLRDPRTTQTRRRSRSPRLPRPSEGVDGHGPI
jgi:hypothetical protein